MVGHRRLSRGLSAQRRRDLTVPKILLHYMRELMRKQVLAPGRGWCAAGWEHDA